MSDEVPYERLSPDLVIDSVESCGFECTGSVLALGSYENRVYQIGTEEGFVVAKFYRPGRWSTDAILEEHDFALELAEQDIPVVPPLVIDGDSLHERQGYRFALYERRGGRWPELGTRDDREWLGRFLGRIHAVGAARRFDERATLSYEEWGARSVDEVLDGDWLPPHLVAS
jgi:Ser/Thr protein kinase RdoA (MazF antagonist)